MNADYNKTLSLSEEVKDKLHQLSVVLNSSVNQGLKNEYDKKKNELINWIEEIEFTINNYSNN